MIDIPKSSVTDSVRERRRLGALFLLLSVGFGLVQIYVCRYQLNPDAMDYLDIARKVSAGHWSAVANGYWGTLDAVLLAPIFALHPSPASELLFAHLHGLTILVAAFFSFRWFLHACLDRRPEAGVHADHPPERALCLIGYGLFLWTSIEVVPVHTIGPDLLVTVFIYLAAAALLRLSREASLGWFILFGAILGVAYWAKAVMFPVGLVFLVVSIFKVPRWKTSFASVLAFVVIAAPLVLALSLPRGRFTFGDSGKLNYSAYVSPKGHILNWQGAPSMSGIPKHPTREIAGLVPIYEFNGPVAGTYPPSYDPSYWNEGRKATFNLRAQSEIIAQHVPTVAELFLLAQPAMTAVFLVLLLWSPRGFLRSLSSYWDLLAISAAIIALYMLVHFETRFVAAFVVLIWFSAFAALRIPADEISQRMASLAIGVAVFVLLLSLASDVARKVVTGCGDSALADVVVAQQLHLQSQTPIAIIGAGNDAYWAHLSQTRIVAQITESDELALWRLPANQRQQLYTSFRATGAQWLIAQPPPVLIGALDGRWTQVGTTGYYRFALTNSQQ
jgi:hypothetical protein